MTSLSTKSFFKDFLGGFFEPLLTEQPTIRTRNGGKTERRNDTQQIARGGIKPAATAARAQPLYMGHPLYQLHYPGDPLVVNFVQVCESI